MPYISQRRAWLTWKLVTNCQHLLYAFGETISSNAPINARKMSHLLMPFLPTMWICIRRARISCSVYIGLWSCFWNFGRCDVNQNFLSRVFSFHVRVLDAQMRWSRAFNNNSEDSFISLQTILPMNSNTSSTLLLVMSSLWTFLLGENDNL